MSGVAWPPEWSRDAACIGKVGAVDNWHPPDRPAAVRQLAFARAKRVCLDCPVQMDCLRYGISLLELEPVEGMYGGFTPEELRALARRLGHSSKKVAQHCTRARYVNGPAEGVQMGETNGPGCRCRWCVEANARDEHERRRRVNAG